MPDELKAAHEQVRRMVNLVSYARHKPYCPTELIKEDQCTCGYLDALDGVSETHERLCHMLAAVDKMPPNKPMTGAEIVALGGCELERDDDEDS